MDLLPKQLRWLLPAVAGATLDGIVYALWEDIEGYALSLSTHTVSLISMIVVMLLLLLLASWCYLLIKIRNQKKILLEYTADLLEYDPHHFENKEYNKWFDHYAD